MQTFFKNFIFAIFDSRAISEEMSPLLRRGIFCWLRTLPQALQFLYFLPLEVTKEDEVTPLFPNTNHEAFARVCYDCIYVKEGSGDPAEAAAKAMAAIDAVHILLPVYVVQDFPKVDDKTKEFNKWEDSWKIGVYQAQNGKL